MNWRDFFYFSKGERRALALLICLIVTAWILLMFTGEHRGITTGAETMQAKVLSPVCIYIPDTTSRLSLREERKEVISETRSRKEVSSGPSRRTEKFPAGTIVELNTADTVILKKVPGIGSAFSNRIVRYRNLLGGFYSVTQLAEVYGIDEERYIALQEWFCVNPDLIRKLEVHNLPADSLSRHPYINYRQARVIKRLCRRPEGLTSWEELLFLEEFSSADARLEPYLSFERK